ncbi:hypothetical protein REPUB_Repub02eG0117800 [Reevesia pubescens]
MDSSEFPTSRSPRKELQGPRPAPLKVRKDSYKIKKPPLAPQPVQQQPTQIRPPVIIYTVSPKVIHTSPSNFMNLVQRLTGSTSSSLGSSSLPLSTSSHPIFNDTSGALSPAARFATIERINSPEGKKQQIGGENFGFVEGIEMNPGVQRTSFFPGILSPGPTSLPPISPNFFSPPSDPNSISFFHDLSPVLHGNRNFIEGSVLPLRG